MRCSAKDKQGGEDGHCDKVARFWAPLVFDGVEKVWMALCATHAHIAVSLGGRVRAMKFVAWERDT